MFFKPGGAGSQGSRINTQTAVRYWIKALASVFFNSKYWDRELKLDFSERKYWDKRIKVLSGGSYIDIFKAHVECRVAEYSILTNRPNKTNQQRWHTEPDLFRHGVI